MKKPKKVVIAGREWSVVWDKTVEGACFDGNSAMIVIGRDGKGSEMELYLHEVLEALLHERGHRYHYYCSDGGNEKRIFSFNHAEFVNIVKDLALILKPLLKE